jgi:hypothetical protein
VADGTLPDGNLIGDASAALDADDSSIITGDAGTDSGLDAAPDVITDAGSDATADAAPDASLDADASVMTLAADVTDGVLALDDANVYFTTDGGAGVKGMPKTGGPTFVVAQPVSGVQGLQGDPGAFHLYLEGGTLYWNPGRKLLSAPVASRNVPATIVGDFGFELFDFAVTGGMAYGASSFQDVAAISTTPDAGTLQRLFDTNATGGWLAFQLDAENSLLDGLGNGIDRIQFDGGVATSLSVDPGTVAMVIQGQTMFRLVLPACNDFGADGGCISTLYTSLPDGTNKTAIATGLWPFTNNQQGVEGIGAVTSKYAFLFVGGGIVRVALATGESHFVYSYLGSPEPIGRRGYIAADDDFLYVVDPTAGLVRITN